MGMSRDKCGRMRIDGDSFSKEMEKPALSCDAKNGQQRTAIEETVEIVTHGK